MPLPIIDIAHQHLITARATGGADLDWSSLVAGTFPCCATGPMTRRTDDANCRATDCGGTAAVQEARQVGAVRGLKHPGDVGMMDVRYPCCTLMPVKTRRDDQGTLAGWKAGSRPSHPACTSLSSEMCVARRRPISSEMEYKGHPPHLPRMTQGTLPCPSKRSPCNPPQHRKNPQLSPRP